MSEDSDPESESSSGISSDTPLGAESSVVTDILLDAWQDAFKRGLFNYDVTECRTKVLPGRCAFVAQLNVGRANKRPSEFPRLKVCQPFDSAKFNFTKIDPSEVLFQFQPSGLTKQTRYYPDGMVVDSPSLVVINVAPVEWGHVLLLPRALEGLPQQLNEHLLMPALRLAAEVKNPCFRIGYNSLAAYASVNHLHFQGYYLAAPFPIERAKTGPVLAELAGGVMMRALESSDYPVRALVFELRDSFKYLAATVGYAVEILQDNDIPFNMVVADSGARVFVIPNMFSRNAAEGKVPQHILDTGINPAVFEISGHMLFKREEDFENATEEFVHELLENCSITDDDFSHFVHLIRRMGCPRTCCELCGEMAHI